MDPDSRSRSIVLGVPRSGTTYLMDSVDASPQAECVSGNLFPIAFAHLAAETDDAELKEIIARAFRHSLQIYLQTGMYASRSAALRKWWNVGHPPGGLRDAAKARRVETDLVYKEPFLAFAPGFFADAIPGAKLVYIYRDGRDVANSLCRSYDVLSDARLATLDSNEAPLGRRHGAIYIPWWVADGEEDEFAAATQYTRALWMWREMIRAWLPLRDAAAAGGPVLSVRYEDLVTDPRPEGRRIMDHLGLGTTERVLARFDQAHPRSIGSYKKRDDLGDPTFAGAELSALGYDVG